MFTLLKACLLSCGWQWKLCGRRASGGADEPVRRDYQPFPLASSKHQSLCFCLAVCRMLAQRCASNTLSAVQTPLLSAFTPNTRANVVPAAGFGKRSPFLPLKTNTVWIQSVRCAKTAREQILTSDCISLIWCVLLHYLTVSSSCAHDCTVYSTTHTNPAAFKHVMMGNLRGF